MSIARLRDYCVLAALSLIRSGEAVAQNGPEQVAFNVVVNVSNADTGQPLRSVRIVPASFRQNEQQRTWQSQYLQTYEGGPALFRMTRGWPEVLLRVEAEGYLPVIVGPIKRDLELRVHAVDAALQPHPGLSGVVHMPDGRPAGGAQVAVCTWTTEVTVRDGDLSYSTHGQKLREIVRTRTDGTFRAPPEVDDWVLLVAHSSGYLEVEGAEFENGATLRLQPWGSMRGVLAYGEKVFPNQRLRLSAGSAREHVVLHVDAGEVVSDSQGRFEKTLLPPTKLFVHPVFGESGYSVTWMNGPVEIRPGEMLDLKLPQPGRAVRGQLRLPENCPFKRDEIEFDVGIGPQPPSISGDREFLAMAMTSFGEFNLSPLGSAFQRSGIPVDTAGRFRIEGLPVTNYSLAIRGYRKGDAPVSGKEREAVLWLPMRLQVLDETDPPSEIDLGELTLRLVSPPVPASP